MSRYTELGLDRTIHVSETGVVKRGVPVKRKPGEYAPAAHTRTAHTYRFAPHGMPKGVDPNLTTSGHADVCGTGLGCPPVGPS